VKRVALRLYKLAVEGMKNWIETLAKNPEAIEEFSRVNFRNARSLLSALITYRAKLGSRKAGKVKPATT